MECVFYANLLIMHTAQIIARWQGDFASNVYLPNFNTKVLMTPYYPEGAKPEDPARISEQYAVMNLKTSS